MSASDKKKLRAAERAEKLTEKQLAEQKEAKKLKIMTTAFVVVLTLMVVFAAYIGITKTIEGQGIREKNTVALTIGDHKINNAELNYFYMDSISAFLNQYGSVASYMGLDMTKPLNEQVSNPETGATWADDFMNEAVAYAKAVYALNDAAQAAGFQLSEKDQAVIDEQIGETRTYAMLYYGFTSLEDYLKSNYGRGASEKTYRAYCEMNYTANAYQTYYAENLEYTDAELRAKEAENFDAYSSFTYNYYYLNAEKFDSVAAAEEAAKSLTGADITTAEALNAAIAALPINADAEAAASTTSTDVAYNSLNTAFADWVSDSARKTGDVNYFASTSEETDENGKTVETVDGYYVILFGSRNNNTFPLINARHILVKFQGGTTDPNTGLTTYTDEEKATAKAAAEEIYGEWKNGAATEESFAALANEKSNDGDGTTGGLYEDIYPNQMVTAFNDWCYDENRKVGDTDIIETNFGYHVMYFCGKSTTNYRDFMIKNELVDADVTEWYNGLLEATTTELLDTTYIRTDLVMNNG